MRMFGTTPINWLIPKTFPPESCGCQYASEYPPRIVDEDRDYGRVKARWFIHRRPDGLRAYCVAAAEEGNVITFDHFMEHFR